MMKTQAVSEIGSSLGYLLSIPSDGSLSDLPLLVYLHGAGERGTDLSHLTRHAVPRLVAEGKDFPAVILCPQCPVEYVWDNIVDRVKALIDRIAAQYSIRKDRICLTGSSMGGFGTWMLAMTYPNFFSAIAPVAGGGMSWRCGNLRSTPVYAVHGDCDEAVPYVYTRMLSDALQTAGADVRCRVLTGSGHNDGIEKAYEETDMIEWLLAQRRTDFTAVPETCSEWF